MSDLANPIFHNEDAARQWLEARVWPNGPVCPHCGVLGQATRLQGKSTRPGLHQCNACREPFTVTVGTLYERSKIPLHKWLHATHLLMASKKGMSALQIGRMLGMSKKTAWFVMHRIRECLRATPKGTLGGRGKAVEVDENYVGGKAKNRAHREPAPKKAIFTLVERGGEVRTQPVRDVSAKTLKPIIQDNVNKASTLMTDEALVYEKIGEAFVAHGTVNHSANEYARAKWFHTNSAENYFSILKRGINGVYHHVSEQHLHRYCAEFDFRYNARSGLGWTDAERMHKSVGGRRQETDLSTAERSKGNLTAGLLLILPLGHWRLGRAMLWAALDCRVNGMLEALPCIWMLILCRFRRGVFRSSCHASTAV